MKLVRKASAEMSMKHIPVEGRLRNLEDIASDLAFTAWDNAKWTTDQCISATGGMVLL